MKCLGIHLGSIEMSTQPVTPAKQHLHWKKNAHNNRSVAAWIKVVSSFQQRVWKSFKVQNQTLAYVVAFSLPLSVDCGSLWDLFCSPFRPFLCLIVWWSDLFTDWRKKSNSHIELAVPDVVSTSVPSKDEQVSNARRGTILLTLNGDGDFTESIFLERTMLAGAQLVKEIALKAF